FVGQLGLPQLIDAEIRVKKRERGYPESENMWGLGWNSILGGDGGSDLNVLRAAAGVCQRIGVNSILAPPAAGEFRRQCTMGDLEDLRRVLRQVAERVRPSQPRDRVTIDLDPSLEEQRAQRQEGSQMNDNGQVGSSPIFACRAEERERLATQLLRGNARLAPVALWFGEQVW